MPSFNFPHRLIFDEHSYNEIKLITKFSKPSIFTMLMIINDKAKLHYREQCVMSKKTFEKILANNQTMPRGLLRAFFKDLNSDEIETIQDDIERTIKLAIDLLEEEPNNCIIITSDEKKSDYELNPHFKDVKNVSVKSGQEVRFLIKSLFDSCSSK